ncbi:MAG: hypothetical protein M1830_010479 [Pleopsidium flavum]|nr:MAG: hypothetical protein M1830_010479 [Pleopsidium flavum]
MSNTGKRNNNISVKLILKTDNKENSSNIDISDKELGLEGEAEEAKEESTETESDVRFSSAFEDTVT